MGPGGSPHRPPCGRLAGHPAFLALLLLLHTLGHASANSDAAVAEVSLFGGQSMPFPTHPGFDVAKVQYLDAGLLVALDTVRGIAVMEEGPGATAEEYRDERRAMFVDLIKSGRHTASAAASTPLWTLTPRIALSDTRGSGRVFNDFAIGTSGSTTHLVVLHSLPGVLSLSLVDITSVMRHAFRTSPTAVADFNWKDVSETIDLGGLACSSVTANMRAGVYHLCCEGGLLSFQVYADPSTGVHSLRPATSSFMFEPSGLGSCVRISAFTQEAGVGGVARSMLAVVGRDSITTLDTTALFSGAGGRISVRSSTAVAQAVLGVVAYNTTLVVSEQVTRGVSGVMRELYPVYVFSTDTRTAAFMTYCCANTSGAGTGVVGSGGAKAALSTLQAGVFFALSKEESALLRFAPDVVGVPVFDARFDLGGVLAGLLPAPLQDYMHGPLVVAVSGSKIIAALGSAGVLVVDIVSASSVFPPSEAPPTPHPVPATAVPTPAPPILTPLPTLAVDASDVPATHTGVAHTQLPATAAPITQVPDAGRHTPVPSEGEESVAPAEPVVNASLPEVETQLAQGMRRAEDVGSAAVAVGALSLSGGGVATASRLIALTHICNLDAAEEKKRRHVSTRTDAYGGTNEVFPMMFHPTKIRINHSQEAGMLVGNLLVVLGIFIPCFVLVLLIDRYYVVPKLGLVGTDANADVFEASRIHTPIGGRTALLGDSLGRCMRGCFHELSACADAAGLLRFPSVPFFVFRYFYQASTLAAFALLFGTDTSDVPKEDPADANTTAGQVQSDSPGLFVCLALLTLCLSMLIPFMMGFAVSAHLARGSLVFKELDVWRGQQADSPMHPLKPTFSMDSMQLHTRQVTTPMRAVQYFFCGSGEWLSRSRQHHVANRFTVLVRNIRTGVVIKYFVADLVLSAALSALVAVDTTSRTQCGHKNLAAAVIFALLLVVEVCWWPHVRPAETGVTLVLLVSKVAALLLSSVAYYADVDDTHMLFSAVGALLLVSVGALLTLTALQLLTDLFVFIDGRRRNAQEEYFEARKGSTVVSEPGRSAAAESQVSGLTFPSLNVELLDNKDNRDDNPMSPLAHLRSRLLGSPRHSKPSVEASDPSEAGSPNLLRASRNFLAQNFFQGRVKGRGTDTQPCSEASPRDSATEEGDGVLVAVRHVVGSEALTPRRQHDRLGKSVKGIFSSFLPKSPRNVLRSPKVTRAPPGDPSGPMPLIPRLGLLVPGGGPSDTTPLCSARTFACTDTTHTPSEPPTARQRQVRQASPERAGGVPSDTETHSNSTDDLDTTIVSLQSWGKPESSERRRSGAVVSVKPPQKRDTLPQLPHCVSLDMSPVESVVVVPEAVDEVLPCQGLQARAVRNRGRSASSNARPALLDADGEGGLALRRSNTGTDTLTEVAARLLQGPAPVCSLGAEGAASGNNKPCTTPLIQRQTSFGGIPRVASVNTQGSRIMSPGLLLPSAAASTTEMDSAVLL